MRFMNSFDIETAQRRYGFNHITPNRARAAGTLARLARWADENSDGWAYWPKPARSAARLMELLEGDGTNAALTERETEDATDAELKAALRPVKSFLTRQGVDRTTVENLTGA